MTTTTIAWFRRLAAKGGKGTVNNIDARCLGRIADDIEAKDAEITALRAELAIATEYGLIQWRKKDLAQLDADRACEKVNNLEAELEALSVKHDHLLSAAHDCGDERDELRADVRRDADTIARLQEALETSSSMMEALGIQLASWGHESVVNYRGQLAKNAALAHLPQEEPSR